MAPDPTEALEEVILGGTPTYTRADLIRLSGVPDDLARALWRALGFPDTGGAAAFTDADLDVSGGTVTGLAATGDPLVWTDRKSVV